MSTITMKFGGTSVGSPEAISNVVSIVGEEGFQEHLPLLRIYPDIAIRAGEDVLSS